MSDPDDVGLMTVSNQLYIFEQAPQEPLSRDPKWRIILHTIPAVPGSSVAKPLT